VIEPGDTEVFIVKLNCHKLNGKFNKKIHVETNDPEHKKVTLVCKGQIYEAINLSPRNVNFGRIRKGKAIAERKIKLSRGDAGPLKPELQRVSGDGIEAELNTIKEGEQYEVVVRVKPKPSDTRLRGSIALKTGVEKEPAVTLNVYGQMVARVSAAPYAFVVPSNAGEHWKQSVLVRWNEGKPHNLLDAKVNHPKLNVSVVSEGATRRVDMTLNEALGEDGLPDNLEVTITTDDPQAKEVAVPVRFRPIRGNKRATRRPAPTRPKVQRDKKVAPPVAIQNDQPPGAKKSTPQTSSDTKE